MNALFLKIPIHDSSISIKPPPYGKLKLVVVPPPRIRIRNHHQYSMQGFDEEDNNAFEVEEGDGKSGLEATLNSLSKWLVSGVFVAMILLRHDAEALWGSIGAFINVLLSIQLKIILNQQRPFPNSRADPGMPSSHAQTIFFAVGFLNLTLIEQGGGVNAVTTTLGGLALITGCYFSWLRVSQQFHTVSQVMVGAMLGSVFVVLWFWCWHAFVFNVFVTVMWLRIVVLAVAIAFSAGFLLHVWRKWIYW
ncbi:hypothetical protein M569_12336 [Genlisea aurea]|uniref:Phosphatidic acid phosphatase type 2/haloperoxidase domain-containing protein n=1 Tax=Genlisea aurea TaxID=192259 RepID=S8DI69_9LAMI|nr:hypothetical protein M569_12336 [Genlisea aurea]